MRREGDALVLVGAGGHARAVVEAIETGPWSLVAYVDPVPCPWLAERRQIISDDAADDIAARAFVVGLGAVDPAGLRRRFDVFRRYETPRWFAPPLVHPRATVSVTASLEDGAMVLAGAIVQPAAIIAAAAILNTGAIVEHDCRIGAGSHIAPGAIVLGAARVGACCMIGAGAVVLPGAEVPDDTLVPAGGRFPL